MFLRSKEKRFLKLHFVHTISTPQTFKCHKRRIQKVNVRSSTPSLALDLWAAELLLEKGLVSLSLITLTEDGPAGILVFVCSPSISSILSPNLTGPHNLISPYFRLFLSNPLSLLYFFFIFHSFYLHHFTLLQSTKWITQKGQHEECCTLLSKFPMQHLLFSLKGESAFSTSHGESSNFRNI